MSSNRAIVVGGGLAGLSAAHTLLERGASVLLLDKQGCVLTLRSLSPSPLAMLTDELVQVYGRQLDEGH
jgi:monoamine oxidase